MVVFGSPCLGIRKEKKCPVVQCVGGGGQKNKINGPSRNGQIGWVPPGGIGSGSPARDGSEEYKSQTRLNRQLPMRRFASADVDWRCEGVEKSSRGGRRLPEKAEEVNGQFDTRQRGVRLGCWQVPVWRRRLCKREVLTMLGSLACPSLFFRRFFGWSCAVSCAGSPPTNHHAPLPLTNIHATHLYLPVASM